MTATPLHCCRQRWPRRRPPPLPGQELADRAAVMNERHRTAKRAQKECADLYLLLLLHAQVPAGAVFWPLQRKPEALASPAACPPTSPRP